MAKENAIEISHLSKIYKIFSRPVDRIKESLLPFHKRYSTDFFAIRDLSLNVKKGETLGIIGKNGAGKSTLLKIVTGVLTPTSGTVRVYGRIASLLELGAGFNPDMTGVENIYMNGDIMGISRKDMDSRIDDIIAFADIGGFINQEVKTYSSGMFARLAFAVNAFLEPDILIVDEALSVGDLEFQSKCYRKFKQLREKGITILLVTHDTNAILNYCSQAVLLEKGSVIAEGNPKAVVDIYKKRVAEQVKLRYDRRKKQKNNVHLNVQIDKNKESFGLYKDKLALNKNLIEYGDKACEITDFAVINHKKEVTSIINNGEKIEIYIKIHINQSISSPIVAFSIKDFKGLEVLGTNTLIMGEDIGKCNPGEDIKLSFKTRIPIHSGKYQLSLGCTEYLPTGLCVHHRLYDVMFLEVVADRETCGIADVQPEINITVENIKKEM